METQNKIPSEESKAELNRLSQDFKPDDVKFLLALNSEFSLQEAKDGAADALGRMEKFEKNNYSDSNLDFQFKKVTKYK